MPTRSRRGVIGQVGRLPDDLAVVGPAAGQLEGRHHVRVLDVAASVQTCSPEARIANRLGSSIWPAGCMASSSRLWNDPVRQSSLPLVQVQGEDVAEVVDVQMRPVDGHGRHGGAERVRSPLAQLERASCRPRSSRRCAAARPGRPRGRGPAPAGPAWAGRLGGRAPRRRAAGGASRRPARSGRRWSPSRRGSGPTARSAPARTRTGAPRGRAPARPSRPGGPARGRCRAARAGPTSQQSAARSNRPCSKYRSPSRSAALSPTDVMKYAE